MNNLKKIIVGVMFFGMIGSQCFTVETNETFKNIDLAGTRVMLENQLTLLDANCENLSVEEENQLALERKNIKRAILHLKELEEHRGAAEYWQKIKAKATKGTIIAAAAGLTAAVIGTVLIWKGINTYREAKTDRDAAITERNTARQAQANAAQQFTVQQVALGKQIANLQELITAEKVNAKEAQIQMAILSEQIIETQNNITDPRYLSQLLAKNPTVSRYPKLIAKANRFPGYVDKAENDRKAKEDKEKEKALKQINKDTKNKNPNKNHKDNIEVFEMPTE
ncbi:hypothetical protein KKA53_02860 [Candidatus Dependentiae bacterium]|nr:hypothetical protein [Candidatus Dependentiae bacterium]